MNLSKSRENPATIEPLEARAYLSAGTLDPTFGVGGKVTTDFSTPLISRAFALAPLPDGRVIAFARATVGDALPLALAQFLPSGKIDPTFGQAGQTFTGFGTAGDPVDALRQPDGKFLVVATHGQEEILVSRFTSTGVIDPTFGQGGKTILPLLAFEDPADARLALAPDGTIFVAIRVLNPHAIHLQRLSADGKTVRTLGDADGVSPNVGYLDLAPNVAVRPDGRILLATSFTSFSQTGNGIELAQFMPDGKPDLTFGQGGTVSGPLFTGGNSVASMAIDNLGRILLLNNIGYSATNSAVARFRANGVLDRTFGTRGVTTLPIIADNFAVQPDGAIVLIAAATRLRGRAGRMEIERLIASGIPDQAFGASGITRIDLASPNDTAAALAILPDGRIIAAGSSADDVALVRLTPTGKPDFTFGASAIATTKIIGPGVNRAWSILQRPDGKYVVSGSSGHTIPVLVQPDVSNTSRGALVRYNADGSLDRAFGEGGRVIVSTPTGPLISAANGKLLALSINSILRFNSNGSPDQTFANQGQLSIPAGTIGLEALPRGQFLTITSPYPGTQLRRYNADGSLDHTFASNGILTLANFTTSTATGNAFQNAIVRGDGTIFLAGTVPDTHPDPNIFAPLWAVYRITAAGQIDRTFANNGLTTAKVGVWYDSRPYALAIGPDGRIVIAGDKLAYFGTQMAVARVNADGTIDQSVGNSGVLSDSLPGGGLLAADPYPTALQIQPDNKILLLGPIAQESPFQPYPGDVPPSFFADWGVFRLNADGSFDNDFGNGGHVATTFGWFDNPAAILFTPDGKLIVAGSGQPPDTDSDFALARYILTDPNPITGQIENRTLKITGTNAPDVILLQIANGKLTIRGMSPSFATSAFSKIEITAGQGNDTIDASAARVPVTIDGGAGNDSILGGQANDSLQGNTGDDTLFGGNGNDTLRGNQGNDYLNGGRGTDNIFGDAGNDQIFAPDNEIDTINGGPGFDRLKSDTNDIQTEIEGILA